MDNVDNVDNVDNMDNVDNIMFNLPMTHFSDCKHCGYITHKKCVMRFFYEMFTTKLN